MVEQHNTIIPQIMAKQEKVYEDTMCRIKDWMLVFLKEVDTLGQNICNLKESKWKIDIRLWTPSSKSICLFL